LTVKLVEIISLDLFEQEYLDTVQAKYRAKATPKERQLTADEHKSRRLKVLSALNGEWQTALEVANVCGLGYKATWKILSLLGQRGEAIISEKVWVDERYRRRKRLIYRSIDQQIETQVLLQNFLLKSIFGINAQPQQMPFTTLVMGELMDDAKRGIKTKVK